MDIPTSQLVDSRLVVGVILFGTGWGIAGFCPGTAATALGAGFVPAAWFVAAMLAGIWLRDRFMAGQRLGPGATPPTTCADRPWEATTLADNSACSSPLF